MLELDASGSVKAENAFAPDGLVARRVGSAWTQYAFDAQENILSASAYDAYGNESSTVTQTDPWGYNGRSGYVTDRETASANAKPGNTAQAGDIGPPWPGKPWRSFAIVSYRQPLPMP